MSNLESKATTAKATNEHHHDIDEDDDQLNISHKIVPTMYNTTTQEPHKKDVTSPPTESSTTQMIEPTDVNVDIAYLIKKEPEKYIYTPVPKDYSGLVRCNLTCHKEGVLSKTFALYFNGQNDNDQTFFLTARKHVKMGGHSEFFIGNDEKSSKDLTNENAIARLKCINITGSEYIFYDQTNHQSIAIIYDTHIIGSGEPRKITVLLHDSEKTVHPLKENQTIIGEWRAGHANDMIEIKNKAPVYDKGNKIYNLQFAHNRVKQASHKNFQLALANGGQEDVILQFGRIDDHTYALDFRYPLTVMQAFAIALSSFHNRFRN